jgi:hypothetical protein
LVFHKGIFVKWKKEAKLIKYSFELVSIRKFTVDRSTPPVGVNEAVSTTSFDVYPNPSDDFFHLTVDGVILNSAPEVVVYTLDGRVVYRDRLTEVTSLLPCADWPSGVYVVALSTTGMREVRRVVVR